MPEGGNGRRLGTGDARRRESVVHVHPIFSKNNAAATPERDATGRRGPAAPPASPLVLPPDVAALNIE